MSILRGIFGSWICWLLTLAPCLLVVAPAMLHAAPQEIAPMPSHLSREDLRQLVAPIALYPDALVAQILSASAYPDQIDEANQFLEDRPDLKGGELASEVDKQNWDPSVKALTQFPTVLANMARNLSWTSALGDAYINQPDEVMDAIQYLRKEAKKAGALRSDSQIRVETRGDTIVIEPADPDVVYVPVYDPTVVFGYPVGVWPGFEPWWAPGAGISFSLGFAVGPFLAFGWGWHHWDFDWHRHAILFARAPYFERRPVFYRRGVLVRPAPVYERGAPFVRGYGLRDARPRRPVVARPLVVRPAPVERGFAARGRESFNRR